MIVTDQFVFLHNLRTGGTFFRYVLRDNGVKFRRFEHKHMEWKELTDPTDREKPVIIFVRNPWEWYVSLYSFEQQYIPGQNAWAQGTFEEVVKGTLCEPGRGLAPPQQYFECFTDGVPDGQLHIGRYENLREDAVRILKQVGCPELDRVTRRILSSPPVNAAIHAPYQDYYTPELRDYVAEHNSRLIQRFGYQFDG
jgi:hypothetical protein